MKRKLIAAILSMVCPLSLGAQDENQNKTETLYTSVTGLRIEQNGSDFWVSFGQGGPQRVKLPVELPADPEEIGNLPDEFHASPNEEWIFAAHHIGSCMRGGELFHRGGADKIDKVEEFNQRWESAVKFGVFGRNFSDEGACNMIDFDGWSADSGRILLTLRGGEDKREMEAGRIYFNTRARKFELTDYLRKLNKSKSEMLACAEPVEPLSSETELKQRFDALDRSR